MLAPATIRATFSSRLTFGVIVSQAVVYEPRRARRASQSVMTAENLVA
jgi:hypothetical protein